MLEPVTRRQRAEISEWQQSAGSARADNGAVYTLSFDNYRPDASNFALPAKGMAVELWLQCDGSGAVESITFSPVPRTKAFWRFRSPRDLAQVPGRRFECQRRRMVKYWFESLLVGVGVMFLMDGHRILLPEQPIRRRLAVFRPLAHAAQRAYPPHLGVPPYCACRCTCSPIPTAPKRSPSCAAVCKAAGRIGRNSLRYCRPSKRRPEQPCQRLSGCFFVVAERSVCPP